MSMQGEFTGNQYRGRGELPAWSELQTEASIEPNPPIVDPHHHLWDHERGLYMLSDFENDIRKVGNIIATVFVECMSEYRTSGPEAMWPVGETEFVARLTAGRSGPPRIAA